MFRCGRRRQGLISSEPSEITIPPEKNRVTKNVRDPDSSNREATFWLIPVIMEAITITTITPIATPRIVSAARILLARNEPSAMATPSKSWLTLKADGICYS